MFNLQEINKRAKTDPAAFALECEAEYRKNIDLSVYKILKNIEKSRIVFISGPSGSGKTTTSKIITEALKEKGYNTVEIALDGYFKDFNPETAPRTDSGDFDFESPFCLDFDLLHQHFAFIAEGKGFDIPFFDFRAQRRSAKIQTVTPAENQIFLFEGIHSLNDMISDKAPNALKIYISARSDTALHDKLVFKGTWIRLARRLVRDAKFRGSPPEFVFSIWESIRIGEKKYISPFRSKADLIFNTALPYEIGVLKKYVLQMVETVPQDIPRRNEILEFLAKFSEFEDIDAEVVPKNSILREFIGGGVYSY